MHPPCLVRRPRAPAPDRHGQGSPWSARAPTGRADKRPHVQESRPRPCLYRIAYQKSTQDRRSTWPAPIPAQAPDRPRCPIRESIQGSPSTSRAGIRRLFLPVPKLPQKKRPGSSTSRAGIRALAGSQVSPSGSGAPFPCTRSTTRTRFGSSRAALSAPRPGQGFAPVPGFIYVGLRTRYCRVNL